MKAAPAEVDLGYLTVMMLAGNMAGLRDRLAVDGFGPEAELVADLVDIANDFLARRVDEEDA